MSEPKPEPVDDVLSHEELTRQVRRRYREFILSRLSESRFSLFHLIVALFSFMTVIGIPLGIWHLYLTFKPRREIPDELKTELEFAERATLVFATPLMVNTLIREPSDQAVPGLFICTFDTAASSQRKLIADIAMKVTMPDLAKLPAADVNELECLMSDEEYQPNRRRRLPQSVTGKHVFYAVDLALASWYLPNQALSQSQLSVPCLADAGDQGSIRHIPYWCLPNVPPPLWAVDCLVLMA